MSASVSLRRNRTRTLPYYLYLSTHEKRALRALARAEQTTAAQVIRGLIVRSAIRKGLVPVAQPAPAVR